MVYDFSFPLDFDHPLLSEYDVERRLFKSTVLVSSVRKSVDLELDLVVEPDSVLDSVPLTVTVLESLLVASLLLVLPSVCKSRVPLVEPVLYS